MPSTKAELAQALPATDHADVPGNQQAPTRRKPRPGKSRPQEEGRLPRANARQHGILLGEVPKTGEVTPADEVGPLARPHLAILTTGTSRTMRRRINNSCLPSSSLTISTNARAADPFRPPATPLVVHDPYFSIWSPTDRLTDVDPVHWTGKPHPLRSRLYRRWRVRTHHGCPSGRRPPHAANRPRSPAHPHDLPLRRRGHRHRTDLHQPSLPDDLDVFSRPLTYVSWKIHSTDGQPHTVQLVFDVGPELAVNTAEQSVTWEPFRRPRRRRPPRRHRRARKSSNAAGDDVRIDWGHAYLAVPADSGAALSTETEPPADGEGLMALDSPLLSVPLGPRRRRRTTRHPMGHARLRRRVFGPLLRPETPPLLASQRRRRARPSSRKA